MTENGEPMLLTGLLTPVVVMGGREVIEAAAEGTSGGERWPDGGDDTDELSGLRESKQQTEDGQSITLHLNETQTNLKTQPSLGNPWC